MKYNIQQTNFIKNPLENCKLLGIPGGGKTQSIIGKIIHHFENGDFKTNTDFLILTFSRRACNDFIEKGHKQNKKYFNTKNIKTLHSLAGKIVYHILEKRSSSQDTIIISCLDLLEKDSLELNIPEFKNLKVIFIDEAQDISKIQFQLIKKIAQLTNSYIILIGDPNQNIYQFQNGSDEFLINHTGKTFHLTMNYRSTKPIVDFINQFRPWTDLTQVMESGLDSQDQYNKPLIICDSTENIIKDIISKILNSPYPREEIAIIGPVKKSKPYNDVYTNIGLSLFTNLLNEYNIPHIKQYEDGTSEGSNGDKTDFKKRPGHINIMTVHGSKGLEFKQVFLVNFHTSTFGITPTEDKYKEFKYLWYVGLSRAAYDLNIYIEKNRLPWYELKNCPPHLYRIPSQGSNTINPLTLFSKELVFKDEIKPLQFSVTEILNSKKYCDDEAMYALERLFDYQIETSPLFLDMHNLPKAHQFNKEYAALYGIFMENIFCYFYAIPVIPDYVIKLKKIILNTIIIPKEHIFGYRQLKVRCPFITKDVVSLADFSKIKNHFKPREESLYAYLYAIVDGDFQQEFFIDCHNDVNSYSKEDMLESINILEERLCLDGTYQSLIENIFKISLFYYERDNETAYLWKSDFTDELRALGQYIDNVIDYSSNLHEEFIIHYSTQHAKLPIMGELDLMNDDKIVDIKFSSYQENSIPNIKHILQVILYNHLLEPSMQKEKQLEIWNFQNGMKYIITLNRDPEQMAQKVQILLKILSKGISIKLENMIFFYDLETTGFSYANNKIDIIERYFEEYSTHIVPSAGLLKPVNVPFIPFNITALTGITMEMVACHGHSFHQFRNEIHELLNICNNPIFIAHNGNSFDHKILTEANILSWDKCLFLDSRMIIRLFLDHPVSNKSLLDIYSHLFKKVPVAHRAEADVQMLIEIFIKLNISSEKIIGMKERKKDKP